MMKKFLLLGLLFSATAIAACPDLTGVYTSSYDLLGTHYDVVSSVTQSGCDSMTSVNVITTMAGVQSYMRHWQADGIFRRYSSDTVMSAVFTDEGLVTTEVTSPKDTAQELPKNFFSRRDIVHLDEAGNLVNDEERFDEEGKSTGKDRFTYLKKSAG